MSVKPLDGKSLANIYEAVQTKLVGTNFDDPEQKKIYDRAIEVASRNGSVYFIFDRDQVTLSACCRLRTTITDNYMLLHPPRPTAHSASGARSHPPCRG